MTGHDSPRSDPLVHDEPRVLAVFPADDGDRVVRLADVGSFVEDVTLLVAIGLKGIRGIHSRGDGAVRAEGLLELLVAGDARLADEAPCAEGVASRGLAGARRRVTDVRKIGFGRDRPEHYPV